MMILKVTKKPGIHPVNRRYTFGKTAEGVGGGGGGGG